MDHRGRQEDYGKKILQLLRSKLQLKMPEFSLAFGAFDFWPDWNLPLCMGTDGRVLYYHPQKLIRVFLTEPDGLEPLYFHMTLHALYLHVIPGKQRDLQIWGTVCDWIVEYWMDTAYGEYFTEERKPEEKRAREYWYEKLRELSPAGRTEDLCRWVKDHRGEIPGLQRLFARDSHPWEKKRQRSGEGCRGTAREELGYLRELEETALWWKRIRGQTGLPSGQGRRKRGTAAGSESRALEPGRRKVYDYRRFLKRYAVFREEMQLDPDSFDYLPYTYSREHYDKLVLLEPLETTEVHRLEELVIAIDTSGSCSGKVVRRFMEETYGILSRRENFFRKMHVVVIQCDSMIQDCAVIRSREEWEAYVKNLKLQGFGGTDFCPAFSAGGSDDREGGTPASARSAVFYRWRRDLSERKARL